MPSVGYEASPTPQTLAHLDSTRTPQTLVKRLGKHTDKQSQPHLNQLCSKSIVLPNCKPAQQMTFWTHASMQTQWFTFNSLSPHLKPTWTVYPTGGHVKLSFPALSYSPDSKHWVDMHTCARPMWNLSSVFLKYLSKPSPPAGIVQCGWSNSRSLLATAQQICTSAGQALLADWQRSQHLSEFVWRIDSVLLLSHSHCIHSPVQHSEERESWFPKD